MATLTKNKAIRGALSLARQIGEFPATKLWIDYDAEADVLYISIRRPQQATATVEAEDGSILLRYRDKELVGITVLDASKRSQEDKVSPNNRPVRRRRRSIKS